MNCHGPIRYGSDHLAKQFCSDITHCINTGDVGFCRFSGGNIATFIQFNLISEQFTVCDKFGLLAGMNIFQTHAGQPVTIQQFRHGAVPAELHVFSVHQWLVVNLSCTQVVSAMNDDYFLCNATEKQRIRRRRKEKKAPKKTDDSKE